MREKLKEFEEINKKYEKKETEYDNKQREVGLTLGNSKYTSGSIGPLQASNQPIAKNPSSTSKHPTSIIPSSSGKKPSSHQFSTTTN